MGFMKIPNLYKEQDILIFKECYALEKIHGTSAHVSCSNEGIKFFSGGATYELFVTLFDKEALAQRFSDMFSVQLMDRKVTVYGEAYGGKLQRMSNTYGPNLKFVVFDVQVGESWLPVPHAEKVANNLGLEFVHYEKVPTTLEELDRVRDQESIQAIRNGVGPGKMREGVVLRPLIELKKNNGDRIIAKHKGKNFQETATARPIDDPAKLKILEDAQAIADEWCVSHRLEHILGKMQEPKIEQMRDIILAMQEDIKIEAAGEIVWSEDVCKAIGKKTAQLAKIYFKNQLKD